MINLIVKNTCKLLDIYLLVKTLLFFEYLDVYLYIIHKIS